MKSVSKDAPDVYKIQTPVRNSNCFGRRSFPYKLYHQNKSGARLSRYQNKIIPHHVMQQYDPDLYDIIYDRIKQESGETVITDELWNKFAEIVGKEREGSTDESSRSHSIILVRSSNRSQCQSPRSPMSESPKSPLKDERQYDIQQSPQKNDWEM